MARTRIEVAERHRDAAATAPAPQLRVVAARRGFLGIALGALVGVVSIMLAVTVFHTRLAERQLQLDVLDREVAAERARYDLLRRERAELASPERLSQQAWALGLIPGLRTEYVDVPADVRAEVAAAASGLNRTAARPSDTPLEAYRQVKEALWVAP